MRVVRVNSDRDTSWGLVDDFHVRLLSHAPWEGSYELSGKTLLLRDVELLAPVTPTKIFAVGRNYAEHAAELGLSVGTEPAIFLKPPTSVLGPVGPVVLPDPNLSAEVEHEAELAVVLGSRLTKADPDQAADAIFGYTCADDVTARDLQRRDTHITRAKSFDTFCPLGPWVETDLPARPDVEVLCRVNGQERQRARTSTMIHDVPELLSYISQFSTLLPGDVVLTGTPAGTGLLRRGDEVEVEIEGIGALRHSVA